MKTTYIKQSVALLFLAILEMVVAGCKDEVLVPVNDTTAADSTIISINKLDAQNVKINAKENTITLHIATVQNELDSLDDAFDNPRKIQYTVYLLNASTTLTANNFGGRTAGVDGATVTVFAGGQTLTKTSVDGRAVFEGLGGGTATVQISATGFSSVTYQTYFFNDNRDSFGDGAVRAASTNVLIFPTSGTDMVTVTGKLYANKSTLDDTLGRQFMKAADATRYLKYVSAPGISDFTNYTQNTDHSGSVFSNHYFNPSNQYDDGMPDGTTVKYDAISSLNGASITGYPANFSSTYTNNLNDLNVTVAGQVLSITYTGLLSFATFDGAGNYSLKVPSYADDPGVAIKVEHYTDDHTFLTVISNIGATKVTLTSFDPATYAHTTSDFYQITSKWIYRAAITQDDGSGSSIFYSIDTYEFQNGYSGYSTTGTTLQGKPGSTVTRNIFFYPTVPAL
jgi:hypothetical protein